MASRSTARPQARAFDAAYASVPNWDIGRPQRPFVYLEEAGRIGERVLEVGCGTGELSMYLARRGHQVLGIDFSRRAIETARAKARWRRIDAQFAVWDVMRLPDLGVKFDAVVDSAMFHCLGDAERDRFVEGLAAVLPSGGSYFVLCDFRPDDSSVYDGGVSRRELRERFGVGWRIDFVLDTAFERRLSRNAALFAGITRSG